MSVRLPRDELVESVIETGLCARCGTCVGACPEKAFDVRDVTGSCLPEVAGECTACGLCIEACPGRVVDFSPLERRLFGDASPDPLLGVVAAAYLAHASDAVVRGRGASGGVVTALLLHLMREGTKGAVLFSPHPEEPYRGHGAIATSEAEIVAAAQSRYHLSPMNTVLSDLKEKTGAYAYVGLPCHVHGLRKLETVGWEAADRIDPIIGIYCGNNLYFEATRVMLRKLGIKNLRDVVSLAYREGSWPGSFTVRTRTGDVRSISKLDFNQAIPFFVNRRCLFCIDLTNELADVSVGDGWAKEGEEDGWAALLARTERGERLVEEATRAGAIRTEAIEIAAAAEMHAHAFDLKKTGAFERLNLWKRWGYAVPTYDRVPPRISAGRRVGEVFVSLQFIICSSAFGRRLFTILPVTIFGRIFRWMRRVWMSSARRRASSRR